MIKVHIDSGTRNIRGQYSGTMLELFDETAILITGIYRDIMKNNPESGALYKAALIEFLTKEYSPLNKGEGPLD